jgi:hypothetical protein
MLALYKADLIITSSNATCSCHGNKITHWHQVTTTLSLTLPKLLFGVDLKSKMTSKITAFYFVVLVTIENERWPPVLKLDQHKTLKNTKMILEKKSPF